jgi:hypothetical protein
VPPADVPAHQEACHLASYAYADTACLDEKKFATEKKPAGNSVLKNSAMPLSRSERVLWRTSLCWAIIIEWALRVFLRLVVLTAGGIGWDNGPWPVLTPAPADPVLPATEPESALFLFAPLLLSPVPCAWAVNLPPSNNEQRGPGRLLFRSLLMSSFSFNG